MEKTPEMFEAMGNLTVREREMLALLTEGRTDVEIAEALCISKRTANNHVCNLMHKLGAKNRVQAAVMWDRYTREK